MVEVLDLTSKLYADGKPKCVIAHTVIVYGISKWEESHSHYARGEEVTEGLKEGRMKYG